MYTKLDDMGELSINYIFVKTKSKIFNDRRAKQTYLPLRSNYTEWDLFFVKLTFSRDVFM